MVGSGSSPVVASISPGVVSTGVAELVSTSKEAVVVLESVVDEAVVSTGGVVSAAVVVDISGVLSPVVSSSILI